MPRPLRNLLVAAIAAVTFVPAVGTVVAGPAEAAVTCDRWASQYGNDGADGSQGTPVKTLRTLATKLAPGQTGCIANGSTLSWKLDGFLGYGVITKGGTAGSPITIRPEPGGAAAFEGRIEVQSGVTDVVITGLTIRSEASDLGKANLIQVNGDRVTLENNNFTHPGGICVGAGRKGSTAYNTTDDIDYADDLVVRNNRIHHCGTSPSLVWSPEDSGAHGVYLQFTRRAVITENLIYSNKYRGLQTWPQALDTTITNNVFDDNATHVNIGSALTAGYPWHSERAVVRNNIMTNRVTGWQPSKNPASIYGNFPASTTPTQYGNAADGNCIDGASAPATGGYGIAFGANTTGAPSYTDRSTGDFRLVNGSACTGFGPQSVQPVASPASLTVSTPQSVSTTPGSTVSFTWTVTNTGGSMSNAFAHFGLTQSQTSPGGRLVSLVPSRGSCSIATSQCDLGSMAPGTSATVKATVDVLHTAGFSAGLTASPIAGDTGGETRVTPTITGRSCTIVGTNGVDSLVGTTGDDVFCGFAGSDIISPGAGNDVVAGGSGNDTVSYSAQSNGVIVNLGQNSAWDNGAGVGIGWDTFTSVESAVGTNHVDKLLGQAGVNKLNGVGGNDEIWGFDGNDTLVGGGGADKLYGGNGNDTLSGGSGGSDLCRQDAGAGTTTGCEL